MERSRKLTSTTDHSAALAKPGGTLVGGTLVENSCSRWWNPGGTLVESSWNLPQTTPGPAALEEIGGHLKEPCWKPGATLVEPSWNLPQTTPDHPAALEEIGGTQTALAQTFWNASATLVEPWWNSRGTLPQGRPGPPRSLSGLRPQSFQLLGEKKKKTPGLGLVLVHLLHDGDVLKRARSSAGARKMTSLSGSLA